MGRFPLTSRVSISYFREWGGGMARDADATNQCINCEYEMAASKHYMVQHTFLKEFQRRINPKVQKGNVFEKG